MLDGTDAAVKNMQLLASLLEVMEAETFASERLVEIKGKLASHAVAGSVAIGKLAKLGQWCDSMDNLIVKGINLPVMYSVQVAWAIQRWRRQYGSAVPVWMEAVAEMEALLSLAAMRMSILRMCSRSLSARALVWMPRRWDIR